MTRTKKEDLTKGFTIIEVLIVLAIAGLIIGIVLFAVPALQRNSRNTAIKNDASNLLSYVSDFNANNDGAMPTNGASSVTNGAVKINSASGNESTGKIQAGTSVSFSAYSTAAVTQPSVGEIKVVYGGKCPDTISSDDVTLVKSTRSTAIVYVIETSGSAVATKCVGS